MQEYLNRIKVASKHMKVACMYLCTFSEGACGRVANRTQPAAIKAAMLSMNKLLKSWILWLGSFVSNL